MPLNNPWRMDWMAVRSVMAISFCGCRYSYEVYIKAQNAEPLCSNQPVTDDARRA